MSNARSFVPGQGQARRKRLHDSATGFKLLDVSASDYTPTDPPRELYIGTGGDLEVTDIHGVKTVIPDLPAGYHPLSPLIIHTTNTTATGIVALW